MDVAGDVAEWQKRLALDPQTSGGLLVACAAEAVDQVLALFKAQGFGLARVVGELSEGEARVRLCV